MKKAQAFGYAWLILTIGWVLPATINLPKVYAVSPSPIEVKTFVESGSSNPANNSGTNNAGNINQNSSTPNYSIKIDSLWLTINILWAVMGGLITIILGLLLRFFIR